MTPVNYLGIAAIIGGGYFAVSNLRTLYSMGCHALLYGLPRSCRNATWIGRSSLSRLL